VICSVLGEAENAPIRADSGCELGMFQSGKCAVHRYKITKLRLQQLQNPTGTVYLVRIIIRCIRVTYYVYATLQYGVHIEYQ